VWVINRPDYSGGRKLRAADYEMDPAIAIAPGDLATIPSVSIVLPQKDLWDPVTGIYVNSHKDASADPFWERACSVEYLDPASATTFSADAGVRVFGGAASSPELNDKMGLRIVFRGEYGPGRLDTDMFERVGPAANRLNTIVLRSHWGSSFLRNPVLTGWAGETYPWEACYMRDIYANESYRATGQLNPRSMMVHLYLNGLYWGLYEAMERPDDSYNAENRGGSDGDYDVIVGEDSLKGYNGALHSGSLVNYRKLFSYFDTSASGSNLSTVTPVSEQALAEVAKYLDLPAFCDYMITLWVLNRLDFPNKNWYGASMRGEPGQPPQKPFVFFTWDSEACLWFDASFNRKIQWDERSVAERWNLLADRDYCQIRLYRRLKLNETFRRLWADRAYKHLFNAGALSKEAMLDRWDRLAAGLDPAIHGELARWGDWVPLYADNPVTKADWTREVALVRDHVISGRVDLVVAQMREFGIYPELNPPMISQSSLQVWPDEPVRLEADGQYGEIRYSLDGSDPRSAGATYTQPIPVDSPLLLRAAMVNGGAWSAAVERSLMPLGGLPLAITEVMYHPAGTIGIDPGLEEGLEFVEITNVGTASVPLDDVALTDGVYFAFAGRGMAALNPGASVLVVRDRALFERIYGSNLPVAGQYEGSLDNGGETLQLSLGDTVLQRFRYDDGAPWPPLADGAGRSLEIHHYELPGSDGASWSASSLVGGTPGSWTAQVPTSDPFAASSSQHGLYWRHQAVFGSYHLTGTAQIYHRRHGWLSVAGNEGSCWLYDYQLGWLYTNTSLYPFLWSANRQAWLYYWNGTQQPRWFFDYALGQWFNAVAP
jgi:hypothetical protein